MAPVTIPKKQPLSKQLSEGFPDAGMFEDIPRVRKISGESNGPYVLLTSLPPERSSTNTSSRRMQDKVIIVTGMYFVLVYHYYIYMSSNLPTGANSALGIGRATVHQFAQNGAKAIFVCDFNDSLLEVHKRELNSLYPKVDIHTRQFDAGDEASVKKVVEEAMEKYGRLDVFFANAGIAGGKIFTETSSEEFMNMMRVNTLRYNSTQMD
jgi:hypothetical protein